MDRCLNDIRSSIVVARINNAMNETSDNVHSDVRRHGIRVARLVEDVGLSIILLATLVAGGIEIHRMWVQRTALLTDLLL